MYKLSKKGLTLLKTNQEVRMKVALAMGISENSLLIGIKRNGGANIANHFDGMNKLIDISNEGITSLRVKSVDKRTSKNKLQTV